MHYYPGENWYALRVKHQYESIVEKSLETKNMSPLHLTYQAISKRKDRKKVLVKAFFPGYMFIKSELNPEIHVEILKSIGVVDLIKNSQGPLPIPEEQINNVLRLKDYEGQIVSFNDFKCGMLVEIVQGPLKGVKGFVDAVERDLIRIGIQAIPGSVAIHVSPSQIEPVESDNSIASFFN